MSRNKLAYGAAVAVMLSMTAGTAIAQDADAIRGKCITDAMKAYPETSEPSPESRARVALYVNCMKSHGLQP
ncbi:MAG: hypothetical protein IT539_03630 [Bradyrhizobiaceae bacterium]|nr:hypothetical protein [Bradyrhizobiaceae bacterium]